MSSSNCCFLTCILVSQEAGHVVWYSHLFHWNKDPAQPKINRHNFFFQKWTCKGQGGKVHARPQMTTMSLSGFILEFMLLLLQSWPYCSVGHSLTLNTSEPLLVDQALKPHLAFWLTITVSIHSPCLIESVFLILVAVNSLLFFISSSSLSLSTAVSLVYN